jgi:hypothetical protein
MTGIGAMAFMSGKRFGFEKSFIMVFFVMLLTDIVYGFHASMVAVYGAYVLAIVIGRMTSTKGPAYTIVGSLLSSIIFFLLTNSVWLVSSSMYPRTLAGLFESYAAGVPFFRNTLIGDFLYLGVFSALSYVWNTRARIAFPKL